MSIRIVCPNCHTVYNATDDQRGQRVRCKHCQAIFRATGPEEGADLAAVVQDNPEVAANRSEAQADGRKSHEKSSKDSRRRKKRAARKIPLVVVFLIMGGVGGSLLIIFASAVVCVWLWNNPPNSWTSAKSPEARIPVPRGRNFRPPLADVQGKEDDGNDKDGAPRGPDAELQPEPPPPPKELDFASPLAQDADPPEPPKGPANPQLPSELVQKVKRATVYLRVALADGNVAQGSGFFGALPNIVLTNAHVIGMLRPESRRPPRVEVILNSGASDEHKLTALVLAVDRDADLAVLRVAGENLPAPLPVRSARKLEETQQVYIFGFPFGAGLGKEITVSQTSVSSLRKDNGRIVKVQVNGGMHSGNSGGPVVDVYGNVIGVAVSVVPFTQINFAVPGDQVYAVLHGRVASLSLGQLYSMDTPKERTLAQVKVPATLQMIDPLGHMLAPALEVWTGDPAASGRDPSTTQPSVPAGDSPHQRQPLNYRDQVARADILLPPLPPGKVYWVQPTWMTPSGESRWATANICSLPPPVERKAVELVLRHQVGNRPVVLNSWLDLKALGRNGVEHTWIASAQTSLMETTEAVDAEELASVRLQYLAYSEKLSGDNQDVPHPGMPQVRQNIKSLAANLRIDKQGNLVGNEVDLSQVPNESRPVLATIHGQFEQAMESMAVPLPNRQVLPGESWKGERNLAIPSLGGFITLRLDMSYTYAGIRRRAGHEEAVLELKGEIRPGRNQAGWGAGRVDGVTSVDVESGQVTQADLVLVFNAEANPVSHAVPSGGKLTLRLQRNAPSGNAGI